MSQIKIRESISKDVYLRHCSRAELAAMYVNDEITDDEYFEAIKKRSQNDDKTRI